jgi:rfaE bifunctional protein nucleotidyltransferase chain/domain
MKVVFTNGCFDILHRGHVNYLQASKRMGDKLIVGINSDASVKRLKGGSRPINSVEDRVAILQALRCVDEVVVFEEDTPLRLIQQIKPDIITKGGDYSPEKVVGYGLAEVVIVPLTDGFSTTRIIQNGKREERDSAERLGS